MKENLQKNLRKTRIIPAQKGGDAATVAAFWGLTFLLICFLSACGGASKSAPKIAQVRAEPISHIQERKIQGPFSLPELKKKDRTQPLKLWATYYRIHLTKHAGSGVPLLGTGNRKLGPVLSAADWCQAALEGTTSLKYQNKRQIYNYRDHKGPSQIDCGRFFPRMKQRLVRAMGKTRFMQATASYGNGVKGWSLSPYRTVATDPNFIAHGSVLYIPQARGVKIKLSNGKQVIHDGYFYAGDAGGAIKGNHIDVFSGFFQANPFPQFVKNSKHQTFQAFLVQDPKVHNYLTKLHQPSQGRRVSMR